MKNIIKNIFLKFKPKEPQIYLCSDLHLGHANIIKYCRRPFKDVDKKLESLISFKGHCELVNLKLIRKSFLIFYQRRVINIYKYKKKISILYGSERGFILKCQKIIFSTCFSLSLILN